VIVTRTKKGIDIRYRDENRERCSISATTYDSYFFVQNQDSYLIDARHKQRGHVGLYGEELTKIIVSHPNDIYDFKQAHPNIPTWEANIPVTNRVLSERLLAGHEPIPNYEHRVWYLDCEWNPTTNHLTVIVVYDSYTEKEYVWFVDKSLKESKDLTKFGDYTYDIPAKAFPSEKEMLTHFLKHMRKQDPDIITGWYVVGADIKTIIERCRARGLHASYMSPYNRLVYSYKDWEQPIVGRNCIDLMIAFSKLWELKNGKLSGYKLDDVAELVLGEKKVELPDGHDTYYTNLPLYVHYCRQDVRLLPKLDAKVNAINHYISLQHLVQCDLKTTPFITKMFTCLVLQDMDWFAKRIPTKPQFEYVPYEGADIMEVDPSVYDNVGILDIKAMYHSNAAMYNISWEKLNDEEGEDCGNGSKFLKEGKGMLVVQMDKMTKMRNKYKQLKQDDPVNAETWDAMQFACKSLVASMYGVAGDSKFGMYHPEVAGAITYTSRQTLKRLRSAAQRVGWETIYGHTDSIFVVDEDKGLTGEWFEKLRIINGYMHPIEVEYERYCDRMLLMAKNRYAGNVVWTDGEWHEPKLYVKGIEMKQSRMPPVMKEAMGEVIGGILANKEEEEVTQQLNQIIESTVNGTMDIDRLSMKGKLEKNLSEYKVLSGNAAAASWSNEFLGKGYGKGSFFKVTLNDKGKYIAFDNEEDISFVKVGYKIICQRFILDKITPYYSLVGWSSQPLENAMQGLGNVTWL